LQALYRLLRFVSPAAFAMLFFCAAGPYRTFVEHIRRFALRKKRVYCR
jgi:hypothetical protein